ncbi:FG-GAP repeat domain-containing protein [Streptomyces sp. NPDC096176]|uniref:FG-GAP repeat domain-containing protein n=1 Tax=Streptomyces sp. NPDC096176 TaxID=3366079 RepID=UPI00381462A5
MRTHHLAAVPSGPSERQLLRSLETCLLPALGDPATDDGHGLLRVPSSHLPTASQDSPEQQRLPSAGSHVRRHCRDDYLVVDAQGNVRAWQNNHGQSGAAWINKGHIATGVGASGDQVELADINGDGRDDYLVVDDGGAVRAWLNNGIVRKAPADGG